MFLGVLPVLYTKEPDLEASDMGFHQLIVCIVVISGLFAPFLSAHFEPNYEHSNCETTSIISSDSRYNR